MREIWEGYKKFGKIIAEPINTAILTFIYLIGIGIPSIFGRLIDKKFLDLNPESINDSYWQELNISQKESDLYRQF